MSVVPTERDPPVEVAMHGAWHVDHCRADPRLAQSELAHPWGASPRLHLEPGAVVEISIDENVPNDSYFRISFDADGEDGFKDPASTNPINSDGVSPSGDCGGGRPRGRATP